MNVLQLKQFGFGFIALGITSLALKYGLDYIWKMQIKDRVATKGIVLKHKLGTSKQNNQTLYMPELEYVAKGETHTYQAESGSTDSSQYAVGSTIKMYYAPSNPKDVIWAGGGSFHDNFALIILSVVFFVVGGVSLFFAFRQ